MRRLAVLVALFATACSREPPNPAVALDVKDFDVELVKLQQFVSGEAQRAGDAQDFRGASQRDDIARWVLTRDTLNSVTDLRDRALAERYPNDARQLLKQARDLANRDVGRLTQIDAYWKTHLPAPFWRRYWSALYQSNGLEPASPDSMLVSLEARMKTALDSGDFESASKTAEELDAVLVESLNQATSRILREKKGTPVFAARKSACPPGGAPVGEKPAFVQGDSIESFYPPESIQRGETGNVVLRAHVDSQGCAQSVAIVVHSGIDAIDAAALAWFESARFSPATRAGTRVDADFTWKVRFVLKDVAPGSSAAAR